MTACRPRVVGKRFKGFLIRQSYIDVPKHISVDASTGEPKLCTDERFRPELHAVRGRYLGYLMCNSSRPADRFELRRVPDVGCGEESFMQNQQRIDNLQYQGYLAIIEATSGSYQEAKQAWIGRKDFSGLGAMLIQPSAKTFVQAGAIAMRTMGDPAAAFRHWRDIAPVTAILAEGIALRAALTPAECSCVDNVDFVACDLLYVQYGLLFSGLRGELSKVRHYHDLPFVRMRGDGEARPNSLSLEARIMFAAWEGDLPQVEALAQPLAAHYRTFKLSPVYTALWKAVAKRDSMALDQLLAEAEAAYRKSARRKVDDPWGGNKSLNEAMFDIYTTSVLKIARDVGMAWDYGNPYTEQIWPVMVIESWEQAGGV